MSQQLSTNAVCFVNNTSNDPFAYDMSVDCDSHALLCEDKEETSYKQIITEFYQGILRDHFKKFVIVCDTLCVIVLTLFCCTVSSMTCDQQDDILEWCQPYEPVDSVIVDLNFGLLVHCDSPRSCVAYAEMLMAKQGYNYNFVIGDEELVYVGHGYQCRSDALRIQMLVTRYTWDPKHPVYKIPGEVVVRYGEILYEGLSCGKIKPNFSVVVKCSVYGDFCGADNIRDQIPWTNPEPLAKVHPRYSWHEPAHQPGHPFLAFDTDRVYGRNHRLAICCSYNGTCQQS